MKVQLMTDTFFSFKDPINFYSIVHFIEYAIVSLFSFLTITHVLIISLFWELFEVFIPYNWAIESAGNKIFDILFNLIGFQCGRLLSKQIL